MHNSKSLLILGILLATSVPGAVAQQIPVGEAADHAVAQSMLTTPGSKPFHLTAKIAEKGSPDSDFKANVEIFWVTPEKWRRTIQSPEFSQTLVVNGDAVSEGDTGDYYPLWLHELVTAIVDPLPMLESLKRTNAQIAKPSGSEQSTSCARFQSKVGVPPVQNSAYSVFCFEGDHGLLESVITPEYSVLFRNYRGFGDKRVARLLESDPEPGTTIDAVITGLSELKDVDESQFTISQPTPKQKQLHSVIVSEAELRNLSLGNPEIAWPSVRSGKTSGVLSIYVSIDNSGHVRETFPLDSDNAGLDDAVRKQVQEWQFKPALSQGAPVQIEGILTFAFNSKIGNPVPILSDAEVRKLASNTVEPIIAPGASVSRSSFTVRVSIGIDGKLAGVENPNNVPDALFLAAYRALKEWHFQPYLKDGKPDFYKADLTFVLVQNDW